MAYKPTFSEEDFKADPTSYLKYGRHVKSKGKPATYKEHIAKSKALKKKAK